VFGPELAAALETLPVGGWQGPVPSAYGVHLLELRARDPARAPALAEVREAVERDLLRARADEAGEAFYRSLRERYSVRIEAGPETAGAPGAGTVAEAR
jgi:parvulin-like peptidyl-prolyl isomerase